MAGEASEGGESVSSDREGTRWAQMEQERANGAAGRDASTTP